VARLCLRPHHPASIFLSPSHLHPRPEAGLHEQPTFYLEDLSMTYLFAQPYDISANGFYFESFEDYQAKAAKAVNRYGESVEEFEIQFIDGTKLDAELAKAFQLSQCNIEQFLDAVEEWVEYQKFTFIIAVGECGHDFDAANNDVDILDVDIYEVADMRALAEQFVDEGLFGDIPEPLQFYIDYDAIARDLEMDHAHIVIAGIPLIYRCA
jgi:antirestriction protein